jgi:hypothetical protein
LFTSGESIAKGEMKRIALKQGHKIGKLPIKAVKEVTSDRS